MNFKKGHADNLVLSGASELAPRINLMTDKGGSVRSIEAPDRRAFEYSSDPISWPFAAVISDRIEQRTKVRWSQSERISDLVHRQEELELINADLLNTNRQLMEEAMRDPLTGLMNRRALDQQLEGEISRARRYGRPLSILMLDFDNFKSYNDRFGHPAGDDALRAGSTQLQAGVRRADYVGRYAGEEFVAILTDTSMAKAGTVARRIRHLIHRHDWPLQQITVSIGVAALDLGCDDVQSLVEAADRALYKAKAAGRDRVCVADRTLRIEETTAA